ncbi:probable Ufm1-specific protease 1 [Phlebotomus argentipes]|uniref:probable Ufm1-specific protease 1 n=1 Tax=Phlebotomus argentipes TaxID=94469 RepID=UPI002892FF91|nr:probable Ufm1-specific protease 1 [Phlebotomus argentipes]
MTEKLLENVHDSLPDPTPSGRSIVIRGKYSYYHYNCDGFQDAGWGCGYRTLQSMCSWVKNCKEITSREVPSILTIQETLVSLNDKPQSFVGSREWIGALEVFYTVDTLFDVSCKIVHIPSNGDVKKYVSLIKQYLEEYGGFIMMGGDVDCSSKGIAGVHIAGNDAYLLVVDPHFVTTSGSATREEIQRRHFVKWQHTSEFLDSSFYNLCLPLVQGPQRQ